MSEWVSELVSEWVSDKGKQWSDSGPIKRQGAKLSTHTIPSILEGHIIIVIPCASVDKRKANKYRKSILVSVEQCNLQMPFQTQLSLQRTMAISLLLKSKESKGLLGRELGRKRFSQVRKTADTWPGEVWISANWACAVPYLQFYLEKRNCEFHSQLDFS